MTDRAPEVVEIGASDTYALRRAVLRDGRADAVVMFAEDSMPGVVHLGARSDGVLVAVSSWIPRPFAGSAAVQLRGMATAHAVQGCGVGGVLLDAGCRRVAAAGVPLVWARARDAALRFYLRHGFEVSGDGFVDESTGLPHHLVLRTVEGRVP